MRLNFLKVLAFLLLSSCYSVHGETITLGADLWCPYNCDPKDKLPGYAVELAQIAFKKAGYNLNYALMPWNRAINEARKNRINGIIGSTKREANDFIFGSEKIANDHLCFYTMSDDPWTYKNLISLDHKLIGTVSDYAYSGPVASYFKSHEKSTIPAFGEHPFELNLKKMESKRVDIVIENSDVVTHYLNLNKLQKKYKNAGCISGDALFIAFGPKNPKSKEYARLIDQTIISLKKSGEYYKILEKYGIK